MIRAAIVGLGWWGRTLVEAVQNQSDEIRFVQDTTNWQIQHTWALKNNLVNNFRFGRVDARADQKGIPCAQSDVDSLQLTGVFTEIPDDQRECPSAQIQGGFNYVGGAINAFSASIFI